MSFKVETGIHVITGPNLNSGNATPEVDALLALSIEARNNGWLVQNNVKVPTQNLLEWVSKYTSPTERNYSFNEESDIQVVRDSILAEEYHKKPLTCDIFRAALRGNAHNWYIGEMYQVMIVPGEKPRFEGFFLKFPGTVPDKSISSDTKYSPIPIPLFQRTVASEEQLDDLAKLIALGLEGRNEQPPRSNEPNHIEEGV